MKTSPQPLVDDAQAAFLAGGVTVSVGSSAPEMLPTAGRANGCRISADRRTVTVLLQPEGSAALLDDLRQTGRIALACAEVDSHRSLQLKGTDARIEDADDEDRAAAAAWSAAWLDNMARIGFARERMQVLVAGPDEALVAVRFTPTEAYLQAPGAGGAA